jgi:hypothetical protein
MTEPATSNFRAEKMKTEAAGSSETYLPNKKNVMYIFYTLLNDAINNSDCTAQNDQMTVN